MKNPSPPSAARRSTTVVKFDNDQPPSTGYLLVFQRCQVRMQLQRLHVSRGRFRETPLNVINHDQHIQSRSPTEPDESEKLSGIVPKNVPGKRLTTACGQSDDPSRVRAWGFDPTHPKPQLESPKVDLLDGQRDHV